MQRRRVLFSVVIVALLEASSISPGVGPNLGAAAPRDPGAQAAIAPPSGNWRARSTGPGVVWAHRFEYATEITAHLNLAPGGAGSAGDALNPYRVADPKVGHAMRYVALGSRLARDYSAGDTTMEIEDATYWPDPAVSGPYYVHAMDSRPTQQNNLFRVTSRNGTSLTVQHVSVALPQQPFAAKRDFPKGSHVGHQTGANWARVFSALTADSNGLRTDDVNAAGTRLRSRRDQKNFPHGRQAFGYGWYGRPEYQSMFSSWRPSDHGRYAIDSILRSDLWDGEEFYIQFRIKVDRRFLALNTVDPNSEDARYGRKVWMLQSQMTVPQQLTSGYGPSNRYGIPSTPQPPFAVAAYSFAGGLASRTLAEGLDGSGSYQPGSQWRASALPKSFLPGGSAWEFPSDEWVTFLLHVRPGLRWSRDNPSATGVRNTLLEVKVVREAEAGYTTVFSAADLAIVYGSSGPNEDTWTTALPGYNAFVATGYLNTDLGSVVPAASYAIDWSEIIFSKQPIAPPAAAG